ncbi:unnamed protein product [Ceutorhynchus assimilis]|uniref:Thioredoxin domain-containing protein n=1 Tax=Ceutorhynchus assimilis TaxID=467358 RepID=A0A9N9MSX0_9CUCU|nr:unnamed protein product [Ceutorhynchus assimilis]
MAKKGQAVQLQIEVANDEEWEKLLLKDGLIVVDVYSDWCGPCLGMQANLKKIKLEFGGDLLQLAVAKSDGITALKRFRNKSEPTWLFISNGLMVNLMFGADAPKLTRLILSELKKEQAQQSGQTTDRTPKEVTELADEEQVRYDAAESLAKAIREKEEAKKAKELLERRTKECESILANLANYGTALVFPAARDKYKEVLNEILDEAGLNINQTEKIRFEEETMEELCYFSQISELFSEESLESLYNEESLMILFKIAPRCDFEEILDVLLTVIYGEMKKPPGSPESAAQKLIIIDEEEGGEVKKEEKVKSPIGIWAPVDPRIQATALRMFFPKVAKDFTIPEPAPEPEHLAIVFPITKRDAISVMQEHPMEIMKHGVFTSENLENTKLVASSLKKLDKMPVNERTFTEKLVLQVSKKKSEVIFAFAQLEPLYMSPNAKEGKAECERLFPEDYPEDEESEEEEEQDVEEEGGEDKTSELKTSAGSDLGTNLSTSHEDEVGSPREGEESEIKQEIENAGEDIEGNLTEEGEQGEQGENPEGQEEMIPPVLPDPPTEEPIIE